MHMALRSQLVRALRSWLSGCHVDFAQQIEMLLNLGSLAPGMAMRCHGLLDGLACDCNFLLLESVPASAEPTQGLLSRVLEMGYLW